MLSLAGAGEGTRTPDLLITNQLLYQLSYAGPRSGNTNSLEIQSEVSTQNTWSPRATNQIHGEPVSLFAISISRVNPAKMAQFVT